MPFLNFEGQGPGRYDLDIVGQIDHQDTLEEICGGRSQDSQRLKVPAAVGMYDNNPHDPETVVVLIEMKLVGYLDHESARGFRKMMVEHYGLTTGGVVCDAIIIGGWDYGGGDQGPFAVKLDLDPEWLECPGMSGTKEPRCGIYAISNRVTRESYVGQSVNIHRRWRDHIRELNAGTHKSKKLQDAWNEYGQDNFDFLILKECEKDELDSYENLYSKNRAQYNEVQLGLVLDLYDVYLRMPDEEKAEFIEAVETINRDWDSKTEEEKAAYDAKVDAEIEAENQFWDSLLDMKDEELLAIDRSTLTENMIEMLENELADREI